MNLDHSLKIISQCPVCKSRRDNIDAKLLDEVDDMHLLHIQCKKCGSCLLVLIFNSHVGVSSIGVVTDLNSEDVLKFRHNDDLNADDLLDFYMHTRKKCTLLDIIK